MYPEHNVKKKFGSEQTAAELSHGQKCQPPLPTHPTIRKYIVKIKVKTTSNGERIKDKIEKTSKIIRQCPVGNGF